MYRDSARLILYVHPSPSGQLVFDLATSKLILAHSISLDANPAAIH